MKNTNITIVQRIKEEEAPEFTSQGYKLSNTRTRYIGLKMKVRRNGVTLTHFEWNDHLKRWERRIDSKVTKRSLSQGREIYRCWETGFYNPYVSTKIWKDDKLIKRTIRKGVKPYDYSLEYAV